MPLLVQTGWLPPPWKSHSLPRELPALTLSLHVLVLGVSMLCLLLMTTAMFLLMMSLHVFKAAK